MHERCLVTGGAGFIGSQVVNKLISEGYRVTVVDNLFLGKEINIHPKAKFRKMDCGDIPIKNRRYKYIFHFGNYSSAPMFKTDTGKRIAKTIADFTHIMELARTNGAKVIYASSSSIQGPVTFYTACRESFEKIAKAYYNEYRVESVGLRFFSVYGVPYEIHKGKYANMITQMFWDIMDNKETVFYGSGNQTRDFIHVSDIANAVYLASRYQKSGAHMFEVGTGKAYSFNQIYDMLKKAMHKENLNPIYRANPIGNYVMDTLCSTWRTTAKELEWYPTINLEDYIKQELGEHCDEA